MNKKNGLVSGDMMQKQQFDTKTLRRLLSYMKDYKGQLIFVVVCILLSAIASAVSALFLQSLICPGIHTAFERAGRNRRSLSDRCSCHAFLQPCHGNHRAGNAEKDSGRNV